MKLFKNYKWSLDLLAALLCALLLLPNLVYWCIPEFTGLAGGPLAAVATVFLVAGAAALIALRHKDRKPFSFFTLTGTLTWLFLLLTYVAWIFFFFGYAHVVVKLFLAVCPCAALLAFEAERKNLAAVVPTAAFVLLYLIAALVAYF